jgi:hypothetical protein
VQALPLREGRCADAQEKAAAALAAVAAALEGETAAAAPAALLWPPHCGGRDGSGSASGCASGGGRDGSGSASGCASGGVNERCSECTFVSFC